MGEILITLNGYDPQNSPALVSFAVKSHMLGLEHQLFHVKFVLTNFCNSIVCYEYRNEVLSYHLYELSMYIMRESGT